GYIFRRSGSNWTEQAKLTATNGANGDYFGVSVAMSADGGTALIGAMGDNENQGGAYIFALNNGSWTQQAKLKAADGIVYDEFGAAVALSADASIALVGATGHVGVSDTSGMAYLYTRSGTSWTQQQKLTAHDGMKYDFFGESVALSADGRTVLVGANGDMILANANQGSAHIFIRSGATWIFYAKLTADDGTEYGNFGAGVALSGAGSSALIGSSQGTSYLFEPLP
ncbi:MAG: FG-GAP repeat protein, partial [Armatimonadetes bacterium]|nr:FG-GAP repeat protein [Anaerolineae bacterium]